jgi:ethanolamine utilization protein EutN
MKLGRVIGTVVSSTVCKGLEGIKLMVVDPLSRTLESDGPSIVACDVVQSGPGDIVYFVSSREAALGLDETFVPVDATIVGFVERVGDVAVDDQYDARGQV